MRKVLIVEDEAIVAMDIRCKIQSMGYESIAVVPDYIRAIDVLKNNKPDLVLIDIGLKGSHSGLDLANLLKTKFDIPFIFITGHFDKTTIDLCLSTSPLNFLSKPFNTDDLFIVLDSAFKAIIAKDLICNIEKSINQRLSLDEFGAIVFDHKTKIFDVGGFFCEITGISKCKSKELNLWTLVSSENILQTKISIHKLLQKGEVEFVSQLCSPKKGLITVSVVAFTVKSREMKHPFFIAFIKKMEPMDLIKAKRPKMLNFEIKEVLCNLGQEYIIKALEVSR